MDLRDQGVDEVAQVVFGPVDVLDEEDHWSVADQLAHELDPGVVEAFSRHEGMELFLRRQPNAQTKIWVIGKGSRH